MKANQVYELRNYTMAPGKRDVLIDLFEAHFTESQEALGAHVVGTFRNLDGPDRFVWFRSFADMEARARALDRFYTSAIWLANRTAANATIVDSDNVLLLRPISGNLHRDPAARAPFGARQIPDTPIVVATYFIARDGADAFAQSFADAITPQLRDDGATLLGALTTEHSPNSYPRLPVRENETVFVALARYPSVAAFKAWPTAPETDRLSFSPTDIMRLQPTPRSLLR